MHAYPLSRLHINRKLGVHRLSIKSNHVSITADCFENSAMFSLKSPETSGRASKSQLRVDIPPTPRDSVIAPDVIARLASPLSTQSRAKYLEQLGSASPRRQRVDPGAGRKPKRPL
jgi:hypothetical protein